MTVFRIAGLVLVAVACVGCATLTSDAMTPVALSFSDGSAGECQLLNKRGNWDVKVPSTASVRRSDDALRYTCKTSDGREATGQLASTVGAKIVASAVFLDFGITDAITDKHREYPASYVIPMGPSEASGETQDHDAQSVDASGSGESGDKYSRLKELDELRKQGILSDEEFEAEKRKILESE